MEGVLQGMLVRYINESAALDELHERVSAIRGERSKTTTWGRHKAKWLENVGAYAEQLSVPDVVTVDELRRVSEDLEGTRLALGDSERERRELDERLRRVAEAQTPEERRAALLPDNERDRFDALVSEADDAVRKLDAIVVDALFSEISEGSMPWPHAFEDEYRHEQAKKALQDGDLVEDSSEQLVPDYEIKQVKRAGDAIRAVRAFLEDECSEEFDAWFREEYGGPPDLSKRKIFDAVIG
jgi:hypothetical protein